MRGLATSHILAEALTTPEQPEHKSHKPDPVQSPLVMRSPNDCPARCEDLRPDLGRNVAPRGGGGGKGGIRRHVPSALQERLLRRP